MNPWFEFDKMAGESIDYYGCVSRIHMKTMGFYTYYLAYQWINLHPNEGIDRPIQRVYAEMMSKEMIDIIHMRSVTPEMWELMQTYSMKELKQLVALNRYPLEKIIHKSFKKNWAKALIETKKWSFNIFAMRSILNDDALRVIHSFL